MSLHAIKQALHIACYAATKSEANLDILINAAWQTHKNIYLPVIQPNKQMYFAYYTSNSTLKQNKIGINEPTESPQAIQLDVIICPLVAFDESGNRVGQGAGFYDRYSKANKNITTQSIWIGAAFECQKTNHIPHDNWDKKLNYIVTEKSIYKTF